MGAHIYAGDPKRQGEFPDTDLSLTHSIPLGIIPAAANLLTEVSAAFPFPHRH
jgi:hypothetical protein